MPTLSNCTTPRFKAKHLLYATSFLYTSILMHATCQVGYGVLTTASYEARKFGVRSGMAGLSIVWFLESS